MDIQKLGNDELISYLEAIRLEAERRAVQYSGQDLLAFTLDTFSEFEQSWHHRKVADFLNRFADGRVPRGMLFMPPRHSKSEMVSRRLPAMLLGRNPDARLIGGSYNTQLARMMSRDVQKIMTTDKYGLIFPKVQIGKQTEDYFEIAGRRGYYLAAGIGSGITGMGASYAIIDDPIKSAEEAQSVVYRDRVWNWYKTDLYTRLERPGSILLTMTRWHQDDLAGRLLEASRNDPEADQWEVMSIPAISEEIAPEDPRLPGEALWPAKYPAERLNAIRKTLGAIWFSAMYQQRPVPQTGGIFQRDWFKVIPQTPRDVVARCRYWDCAASEDRGDYTVGTRVALCQSGMIVVESVVRGQWSPATTELVMKQVAEIDGITTRIREEQEPGASGKTVIAARLRLLSGYDYRGIPSTGEKTLRWQPFAAQAEGDNVRLLAGEWVGEWLDEMSVVPSSKNDDQADSVAGAYNDLTAQREYAGGAVRLKGF